MRILTLAKSSSALATWAAVWLCTAAAWGVDLPHIQPGTLAQPQVHGVLVPEAGGNPYTSDFLGFNVAGYLDTGTSGVVIGDFTATFVELPTTPNVKFEDVAVGGSTVFNVSTPFQLRLNSTNNPDIGNLDTFETVYDKVYGPLRAQVGPTDSFFDIYGMPVMIGKHVVIDPKQSDPVLLLSAPAYIYEPDTPFNPATQDTNPGIPETSHHVQLSYGDFSRFTKTTPTGAEPPVLAHNPFIGPNPLLPLGDNTPPITIAFGGRQATGSFLLDTAGGASLLSSHLAEQLGVRLVDPDDFENPQLEMFDPDNPGGPGMVFGNQFQVDIEGVGGVITIAGFNLEELILHTMEGSASTIDPNNLRFPDAPMFVYDISVRDPITQEELFLDGTLGMNFLLDSVLLDGLVPLEQPSYFKWITFDEPNGILGLDLGIVVPEPSSLALAGCGLFLLAGYAWRRRRLRSAAG